MGKGGLGEGWTRNSAAFGCRDFVGGSGGRETINVRMLFTVIAEVISLYTLPMTPDLTCPRSQ